MSTIRSIYEGQSEEQEDEESTTTDLAYRRMSAHPIPYSSSELDLYFILSTIPSGGVNNIESIIFNWLRLVTNDAEVKQESRRREN